MVLGLAALVSCGDDEDDEACPLGGLDCGCDDGTCGPGLICGVDDLCRDAADCEVFGCAAGQRCEQADGGGATCQPECDPGYRWDSMEESCQKVDSSCDEGAGSVAAQCAEEHRRCVVSMAIAFCAGCRDEYVEQGGGCRPVLTCEELQCGARSRTCTPEGRNRDAACGGCVDGATELDGVCTPLTCAPAPPAGMVTAPCGDSRRVCLEAEDGVVSCGDCWPGHLEEDGECRPVRDCLAVGCAAQDRTCTAAGDHTDARCEACRAGFEEVSGACVPVPGSTCDGSDASIAPACAAENRVCAAGSAASSCQDCVEGYVWDPALAACVERVTCGELDCGSEQRTCVDQPNGHCGDCVAGHTENPETGTCRETVKCAALECAEGSVCQEGASGESGDAACVPDCESGTVWNGQLCQPCPPCDAEGEVGRWPVPSRAGYCICETESGYFYSTGGDIGTVRCDADGDGWVRESARVSYYSDDRVLSENARCDLRIIDRVELENERGQIHEEVFAAPLALFESDRNDDEAILASLWASRRLPPAYGTGPDSRLPRARELNRLTKACHDIRADYNDNGAFDVSEYASEPPAPVITADNLRFNELSYFLELHYGYYEAPADGNGYGRYRIVERARPVAGEPTPMELPLTYDASDGPYWRSCERERDAQYDDTDILPVGMDFASYYTPPSNPYEIPADSWRGMMHHSQFKCLVLSTDPDPSRPTLRSPGDLADARLNRCSISGDGEALGSGPNAEAPVVSCAVVPPSDPSVTGGAVFWGSTLYLDHGPWGASTEAYERGCRNGCYAALSGCEGYDVDPRSVLCEYDEADFGRFESCRVIEICDGVDNDGDPASADGSEDPLVGLPCEPPGALGACLEGGGVYECLPSAPYLTCTPNVAPALDEVSCDGVDEDCDGRVDEGDPGLGEPCDPTSEELDLAGLPAERRNGRCVIGEAGECQGGRNLCTPVNMPQAEICGNGIDEDCDAITDENELLKADGLQVLATFGVTSQPGCQVYGRDSDGDTYGDKLITLCLCDEGPSVQVSPQASAFSGEYVYGADDCCDTSSAVSPAITAWHADATPCGGYDWNCKDGEEKYSPNLGSDVGCRRESGQCAGGTTGWVGSIADCGDNGEFYTECEGTLGSNFLCSMTTIEITQLCR